MYQNSRCFAAERQGEHEKLFSSEKSCQEGQPTTKVDDEIHQNVGYVALHHQIKLFRLCYKSLYLI